MESAVVKLTPRWAALHHQKKCVLLEQSIPMKVWLKGTKEEPIKRHRGRRYPQVLQRPQVQKQNPFVRLLVTQSR